MNSTSYHTPEEVLEDANDKNDDFEYPDFSTQNCVICGAPIDKTFSWYYLVGEKGEFQNVSICSCNCLDTIVKELNNDNYEIYEFSRCTAYYKCEEIENLRNKCEKIENKTYKSISPFLLSSFCEPAQAGSILSTHKLMEVLSEFSNQTEKQFLANKEMMETTEKASSKQFKITMWMTILVIILTILNTGLAAFSIFVNMPINTYLIAFEAINRLILNPIWFIIRL